ncbi:MAG: hypothetical protein M1833_006467 [Piccolia ochrophora]|nr:MAG: hypothetical protein M1833_006467 [Piccolia ochrophora]
MALPPEVIASYSAIIDGILATSDLTKISSKQIREGLQAAVQYDLGPQKAAIKDLILARFDKFNAERLVSPPSSRETATKPLLNGHTNHAEKKRDPVQQASPPTSGARDDEDEDDDAMSDVVDAPTKHPKKKRKTDPVDDDAVFAAKLQAEENNRARPTRGGMQKRVTPSKKKRKTAAKSKSSVNAEDDSDLESGSGEKKRKVNRTGGFHKQLTLSPPLAQFLGETTLSRPETVKRIWKYVKENDLQDPSDKRQIRCDDPLKAVFKQDRVHMFTMNKVLSNHLFAADE